MRISKATCPAWLVIFAAFVVCHVALFIRPVFLNSDRDMHFPKYVSKIAPIGCDLRYMLSYSQSWMSGNTPYIGDNLYPPLSAVFFSPLALLDERFAYAIMTATTLLAFLAAIIWAPFLVFKRPEIKSFLPVAILGLLSYGLQFEIERGQFNVIAGSLALLAVCLFHAERRIPRIVPYLIFVIAVQLKVYPAIFVLAFVRPADRWSRVLSRWVLLGVVNVGCLVALGPRVFVDFLGAIRAHMIQPYCWIGNHSLRSFVWVLERTRLADYSARIGTIMLVAIVLAFSLTLYVLVRRRPERSLPYFVLTATCVALILPAVSHDYTLPLLAMAYVLFVAGWPDMRVDTGRDLSRIGLFFALSVSVFWTFSSYVYKSDSIYILKNNFLPILSALVMTSLLSWTEHVPCTSDTARSNTDSPAELRPRRKSWLRSHDRKDAAKTL